MFKVRKLVLALGCATVLGGCASSSEMWSVKPVMNVKHAAKDSESMYRLGRYYQGKINYTEAIASYEKALAADPNYVEAHNGLGVVYSLQGRHELAQRHLARAIELAPGAVHLHNNLGYAYLIQGRDGEAAAAFEQALRLEPANQKALANLAIAYERVGLHDKAAMLAHVKPAPAARTEVAAQSAPAAAPQPVVGAEPAAALAVVAQPAPTVVAQPTPTVVAQPAAQPAPMVVAVVQEAPGPEVKRGEDDRVVQVAPNVFELKMAQPPSVLDVLTAHATAAQDATNPDNKRVRLEVSNGNGVTGMARHVSGFMQKSGFAKARLTNQKPFRQAQTEIHYRSGNEAEADRIARMMPRQVVLMESDKLRKDIQVRIVLGRDVSQEVAYFGIKSKTQLARKDGKLATKE